MRRVVIALDANINFIVTIGSLKGWWPNMEFQDCCLDLAEKAWEFKVSCPVILGFQYDRPVLIELPDNVDSEKRLLQFIHYLSEDDVWDALRVNMVPNMNIGDNNLEMVFISATVFPSGEIDLIYIPFNSMDWQEYGHFPEHSLP